MSLPLNRDGLPAYQTYPPAVAPSLAQLQQHTAEVALAEGYDPADTNASISQRAAALLIDGAVYTGLVAALAMTLGLTVMAEAGMLTIVAFLLLGPAGFFAYRAAGDAIFEGSPGKHLIGLEVKGKNGMPVSAADGLTRNVWILPSLIPAVGWFITAGMLAWMAYTSEKDLLGRGVHERNAQTRVVVKRRGDNKKKQ